MAKAKAKPVEKTKKLSRDAIHKTHLRRLLSFAAAAHALFWAGRLVRALTAARAIHASTLALLHTDPHAPLPPDPPSFAGLALFAARPALGWYAILAGAGAALGQLLRQAHQRNRRATAAAYKTDLLEKGTVYEWCWDSAYWTHACIGVAAFRAVFASPTLGPEQATPPFLEPSAGAAGWPVFVWFVGMVVFSIMALLNFLSALRGGFKM